jgi:hypothetical protein
MAAIANITTLSSQGIDVKYLMQFDHMTLIYSAATLIAIVLLLVAILVKFGRQLIQTQKLIAKLDGMVNQVLTVGDKSDYGVRNRQLH